MAARTPPITIDDVASAYQGAHPGTTDAQAMEWARAEVKKHLAQQMAQQAAANGNGSSPEVPVEETALAQPKVEPWKPPIYEAAEVLMAVDAGKVAPLEGLQAAAVLLLAAAAKL